MTVQTGQEEMRAETHALEQTQSSQQCEPNAGEGEGKGGGRTDLERHPSLLRQTALRPKPTAS
jgi:hypothetical protein